VALNWQLRPLLVDEAMERKITAQVVREGVRTAVYTKRLTRPALTFYVHDLGQAGVVVCHGDRLFLADAPYAGHNITDVYSARPGFWKDATVFAYLPLDLDTVRVEHLQRPAASFQLARNGDEWQPAPVGGTPAVARKNEALINRYVTYFQQVPAEAMLDSLPASTLAGVHQHLQHRISIKSARGNLTVELFGIPPAAGEGYDTDKCLLFIVETKEWARASWVSFDLLLRDLRDFVKKNRG
jgi:hypothetical protein